MLTHTHHTHTQTHLHIHNTEFLCLSFCYLFLILHIAVATVLCTTNNQDITKMWDFIRGSCRKLLLLLHLLVEDILYSSICKCPAVVSAFTKHGAIIRDSISHYFFCRFSSVIQWSDSFMFCQVRIKQGVFVVFFLLLPDGSFSYFCIF